MMLVRSILLSVLTLVGGVIAAPDSGSTEGADAAHASKPHSSPGRKIGWALLAGGAVVGISATAYGLSNCSPFKDQEMPRGCDRAETVAALAAVTMAVGGVMILADRFGGHQSARKGRSMGTDHRPWSLVPVLYPLRPGEFAGGLALTATW